MAVVLLFACGCAAGARRLCCRRCRLCGESPPTQLQRDKLAWVEEEQGRSLLGREGEADHRAARTASRGGDRGGGDGIALQGRGRGLLGEFEEQELTAAFEISDGEDEEEYTYDDEDDRIVDWTK